jgi:ribosomal protein S18 acetylase RimI-like enzyme
VIKKIRAGNEPSSGEYQVSEAIKCRLMEAGDINTLASIYNQLQAYHGHVQDGLESLKEQLGQAHRHFEIIIAEQGERILGFALFSIYPGPSVRPGIFLKELFVSDESRGLGVGKHLMQALAAIALERGYQRIDLTTQADNFRARSFYEQLGAKQDPERVFYRFAADSIAALAE